MNADTKTRIRLNVLTARDARKVARKLRTEGFDEHARIARQLADINMRAARRIRADDAHDPRAFLRVPIRDAAGAVEFIRLLDARGLLFHFDDSPETIINVRTRARVFTNAEVPHVRARVAELFALLEDPFSVALDQEGAQP